LHVEERGAVLRVVLARPERQNSIDGALLAELGAVLDRAERTAGLRILSLEGAGPVFCSGMDFVAAARGPELGEVGARGGAAFFDLLQRFTTLPRVVVSRVDGRVTGGGVGLVAASDLVYATERSSFGLPEALWGLLPCCVLPFLIRRVGFQPAYAMTLSTLPVSAREAERIRLVDAVVDPADDPLRQLGARLTRIDDVTIADCKRYFGQVWPSASQARTAAIAELGRLMSSPAVQSRIANFASHQRLPWETS
jgi:polyketide biosynthesis enoyl-CoA hydratase PksH